MKRISYSLAVLLPGCLWGVVWAQPESQWIQLFNGQDLNGWQAKFAGYEVGINLNETFRVEDGVLRVSYEGWEAFDGQFGHLIHDGVYSRYRLRVEYRFVGDQLANGEGWAFRNNGMMLHTQAAQSMSLDQQFPVSIEAQMLGGNGTDERSNANVCTPGTHIVMAGELITTHCINSSSATYHGDGWVTMEIEVNGSGPVRHWLDGEVVLEYEGVQLDPADADAARLLAAGAPLVLARGHIAIQAETHPTEFRRIELLPLD